MKREIAWGVVIHFPATRTPSSLIRDPVGPFTPVNIHLKMQDTVTGFPRRFGGNRFDACDR